MLDILMSLINTLKDMSGLLLSFTVCLLAFVMVLESRRRNKLEKKVLNLQKQIDDLINRKDNHE